MKDYRGTFNLGPPTQNSVADLDAQVAELSRAWVRINREQRADLASGLDRMVSRSGAAAAYIAASLANELPARDREELIGLLRARVMP